MGVEWVAVEWVAEMEGEWVAVGGGGCGLRVARIAVPVAVDVGIWGLTANPCSESLYQSLLTLVYGG